MVALLYWRFFSLIIFFCSSISWSPSVRSLIGISVMQSFMFAVKISMKFSLSAISLRRHSIKPCSKTTSLIGNTVHFSLCDTCFVIQTQIGMVLPPLICECLLNRELQVPQITIPLNGYLLAYCPCPVGLVVRRFALFSNSTFTNSAISLGIIAGCESVTWYCST